MDHKNTLSNNFTACWKLDRTENYEQVLKTLGRSWSECQGAKYAAEDFNLIHLDTGKDQKANQHRFSKNVRIYLDPNRIENTVAKNIVKGIVKVIGSDQKSYQCDLLTGLKQFHEDDDKGFGKCSSLTYFETKNNRKVFTIKWFINNDKCKGTLIVQHYLTEDDELFVKMKIKNKVAKKYYKRHSLTEKEKSWIKQHQ